MRLDKFVSRGLAHNSYYLSDGGEAMVVDPRRDCQVYLQQAEAECAKIMYVLETHRNEDYAVGSLELQSLTGAEIAHSRETQFGYGERSLSDGDVLEVGRLKVEAIYTPGHTNDSICYAVYDPSAGSRPFMVFTGDTLFVGGMGRTDLLGADAQREQAEKLYDSIYERLLPLGDEVIIYPAHGAGSLCGAELSDREISTIGLERSSNHLLNVEMDDFMEETLSQRLPFPPYFKKMERLNTKGPPLLRDAPAPKPLTVTEFEDAMQDPKRVVLDTREPGAFAGSHITGSINIWLDGVSHHPGWVLSYDDGILLVTERKEDVETARAYLNRIGFDRIDGYLCPDIRGWRNSGRPFESFGTLSISELRKRLDSKELTILDVRTEEEWNEGHIAGAEWIYVGNLPEDAGRLPRERPIATICSWGGRSGLGASILKRKEFKDVYNVLGGMRAWHSSRYPVERD